jgi:2-polyprenyl-6-methoxyphenol hydroxylase-like FAD-dependent oxidoreductase
MAELHVPVVIVGAGPTGLLMSLLLAQHGTRSAVIERRKSPSLFPRAHALNPRSLEICSSAGINLNEIRKRVTAPDNARDVRFLTRLLGAEVGALPYERQDEAVLELTPTPLVNIAQPDFEEVLLAAVRDNPLIELWYGHEWRAAANMGVDVRSTIYDQRRSTSFELASDYLIACDGANSPVREALAIPMDGVGQIAQNVNIQFSSSGLAGRLSDRPAILYWTLDPEATGTFIAYRLGENMVFAHNYDPVAEPPESFTPERCRELVSAAVGDPSVEVQIKGVSHWVMTSQVAQAYRSGRIFLAGDAAHRFPPAGGLGLNTGIGDVHNLAWKIAAVQRSWGGEALLDSYERERRPIAVANADQSMINVRRMSKLFHTFRRLWDDAKGPVQEGQLREELSEQIEAQREHFDSLGLQLGYSYADGVGRSPQNVSEYIPSMDPGVRLPHAWVERSGERVSSLDLISSVAFSLITGPSDQQWRAAAALRPLTVKVVSLGRNFDDPEGDWRKLSGIDESAAVLVRPDGHIVKSFKSDRNAVAALEAELASALGLPSFVVAGGHAAVEARSQARN